MATPQDPIALLRGLNATRAFRPDPIPQPVVDDLLTVARWTGSARNLQPWEFVLVRERATLEALAACEGSAKHTAGAALAIVLVMAGNPDFDQQETFDEGRLSERILLAAEAHGVGGCIGWWKGDGRIAAKRLLGIPQSRLVRTEISLGYPDMEALAARPKPPQARKPLAELLHEERYRGRGA